MNLLLLRQDEMSEDGAIVVEGRRAKHIKKVLRLKVGDHLRVGKVNGPFGRATLLSVDWKQAVMTVEWGETPPLPSPNILVLAVARPIMLRRALFQAVGLGLRRIHLIRSAKVEKSFFDSSMFEDGAIDEVLRLALEQAIDTHWPEVFIHKRFRPFVEDVLPKELEVNGLGLVAHPGDYASLGELLPRGFADPLVLAIGPEGGWVPFEIELFQQQGMKAFSMGSRILRVDTAVPALLAQISLLREAKQGNLPPNSEE